MKTIFIIVTKGFIVRNILRSGVLELLKSANFKIVIFISSFRGEPLPEYFINEFADENVLLEVVKEPIVGKIYRKFYKLFSICSTSLIYTETNWSYSRIGNVKNLNRNIIWAYVERMIFPILSKFVCVKRIARWLELHFFTHDARCYYKYFDKYDPDLVFSTSIISKVDVAFLKAAQHRKVKTVSMTKGWDHIAKVFFKVIPDRLVVQNNHLRDCAIRYQMVAADKIDVCGFPNFDWYRRKDIILSREDLFKRLGFDPSRRLIFFGSEGIWASNDDNIVDILENFIDQHKLAKKCNLLVRPHFTDLKSDRFNRFKNKKNIKVDNNLTQHPFFSDTWDPSVEEVKLFVNCIYHCDIMVTIASTLALDACCLDKPIITVGFKSLYSPRTMEDLTHILYETDHYREVLDTNAVDLVKNEEELLEAINNYLLHPEFRHEEREALLDKLCYKVDGQSSSRIAEVIKDAL